MNASSILHAAALAAASITLAACPGTPSAGRVLEPVTTLTLPVAELSGLALRGGDGDGVTVFAIGDDDDRLAHAPLVGLSASKLARIDLGGEGRELEAVAIDGAGRVYVLNEPDARIHVFEVGGGGHRLAHTYEIEIPEDHPLHKAWRKRDNSRGEGLLVLDDGRFLLAKQKKPLALIELGSRGASPRPIRLTTRAGAELPPGSSTTLVPLAWWRGDEDLPLASLNDLARGPSGEIYVVGSKPRARIGRIALPLEPSDDAFRLEDSWEIEGADGGKAEGLAITGDGRALVGLDADEGETNVLIVPLGR